MTLLADLTTLGVGGVAGTVVTAWSSEELVDAVRDADAAGRPALILGAGSNVVCADDGFAGDVICVRSEGIAIHDDDQDVVLTAAAGVIWDDLVEMATVHGWAGVQGLSGIPGTVGATPMQNVGAYGQEVAQVIQSVQVWDRHARQFQTLTTTQCRFAYRTSALKSDPGRYVVLSVSMRLPVASSDFVRYQQLADALDTSPGDTVPIERIRRSVLELRRAKGMVLDPTDSDTRSCGSFFTNPVVTDEFARDIDVRCPRYAADGGVKLSAAWLIEASGIPRGYRLTPHSDARVSTKHTLALTNAGNATASQVMELAQAIRQQVHTAFGVDLLMEPVLVGV